MDIINEIKTFLKKYKLLNKDTHFLIGFSGGADSMLLLYYLNELKKEYNFKLSALHINHNWRGKESDLEENNCFNFCKNNSIDFYAERLSPEIKQDENSARVERYKLFSKYAKKFNAKAILTAHNSDDVIETFLYRLIKGTGTTGALSIPEIRDCGDFKIFRPLLNISSTAIRNKCQELNLNYNIDSSNSDNKYKRNFIRNEILPQFKKINQNYEYAIHNFIENLKSNNQIIEDFYGQNCEKVIENNILKTQIFIEFSKDIKRVIIYKFLKQNSIEPEKKLVLNLIKHIEKNTNKPNGKKYSIKNAENSDTEISFFCSQKECYFIENKITNFVCQNFKNKFEYPIETSIYNANEPTPKSNDIKAVVNVDALDFPLELRTRKKGDLIQPFSHKSIIKLKDYFIDKKIPEHKRDEIPLLCKGKEVLWVIGVGLSEKMRAELNNPQKCIIIKYTK